MHQARLTRRALEVVIVVVVVEDGDGPAPDRGGCATRLPRLNIISHLLSQVPYAPLEPRDIALPKRQAAGKYTEPDLPLNYIPTPF